MDLFGKKLNFIKQWLCIFSFVSEVKWTFEMNGTFPIPYIMCLFTEFEFIYKRKNLCKWKENIVPHSQIHDIILWTWTVGKVIFRFFFTHWMSFFAPCHLLFIEFIYATLPRTQRGQPIVLGSDPKGKNFLYCNGNSVIIRNIDVSLFFKWICHFNPILLH